MTKTNTVYEEDLILLNGSPKLDRFQYMALSIFGRMTFYLKSVSFKDYLPPSVTFIFNTRKLRIE